MKYFTLTNDPDHGMTDNYEAIFRELSKNNIFITTAVFCTLEDDRSALAKHCNKTETHTLKNKAYRNLMLKARDEGHEIAYHGYSQISNSRDEFLKGINIYKSIFGYHPRVYVEHGGHPSSHELSMVKRENLAYEGNNSTSKYHVEDIIRETFDLVWTHEHLLDKNEKPMKLADYFTTINGITFFKRLRMYHYLQKLKGINETNNTIIGYTHFGYKGYLNKWSSIIRPFFKSREFYELWFGNLFKKTIFRLSEDLNKYEMKNLTISQLFKEYNNLSK